MKTYVIPCNFVIPPACKEVYKLRLQSLYCEVKALPPNSIEFSQALFEPIREPGREWTAEEIAEITECHARDSSLSLDWMQESVEHLRALCEG